MGLFRPRRTQRVFVDAKITGRHDPNLPKRTWVAYVVEHSETLKGVKEVEASETDDAELHAILFALRELKKKIKRFTIVSDHESVVSEANREPDESPKTNPLLKEVWSELANKSVKVVAFEVNPAHRVLSEHLQLEKKRGETEGK